MEGVTLGNMMQLIALLALTSKVNLAPLLSETDGEPRESTKAILNLEQQLKESAGEDKKFLPPPPPAPPVVDGLEPLPQDEERLQSLASMPDSNIEQRLDTNPEVPQDEISPELEAELEAELQAEVSPELVESEVSPDLVESLPVDAVVPSDQGSRPVDPSIYDYLMTVLEEHPEFKQILQSPENSMRSETMEEAQEALYPQYESAYRNNVEQSQPDSGDTSAYVVSKKGSYQGAPPEYQASQQQYQGAPPEYQEAQQQYQGVPQEYLDWLAHSSI